jgi:hypothetical protein
MRATAGLRRLPGAARCRAAGSGRYGVAGSPRHRAYDVLGSPGRRRARSDFGKAASDPSTARATVGLGLRNALLRDSPYHAPAAPSPRPDGCGPSAPGQSLRFGASPEPLRPVDGLQRAQAGRNAGHGRPALARLPVPGTEPASHPGLGHRSGRTRGIRAVPCRRGGRSRGNGSVVRRAAASLSTCSAGAVLARAVCPRSPAGWQTLHAGRVLRSRPSLALADSTTRIPRTRSRLRGFVRAGRLPSLPQRPEGDSGHSSRHRRRFPGWVCAVEPDVLRRAGGLRSDAPPAPVLSPTPWT